MPRRRLGIEQTTHTDFGMNVTTLSGEYVYRKHLKNGVYIEPQAERLSKAITTLRPATITTSPAVEASASTPTAMSVTP